MSKEVVIWLTIAVYIVFYRGGGTDQPAQL